MYTINLRKHNTDFINIAVAFSFHFQFVIAIVSTDAVAGDAGNAFHWFVALDVASACGAGADGGGGGGGAVAAAAIIVISVDLNDFPCEFIS